MKKGNLSADDINVSISVFTGKLIYKDTGKIKMCDICDECPAMWLHDMKNQPTKQAYLCFKCGNH